MKNHIDFSKISFILMDIDGVLTDGSLLYGPEGEITKVFSVYDGHGIYRGHQLGLKFGAISGREAEANQRRAEKLKLEEMYQNCNDKVAAYEEIKAKYGLTDENFCYVGDEVFDLPLLRKVAFSCAPSNALPEVKGEVDYVTSLAGGKGAVREIIDIILKERQLI